MKLGRLALTSLALAACAPLAPAPRPAPSRATARTTAASPEPVVATPQQVTPAPATSLPLLPLLAPSSCLDHAAAVRSRLADMRAKMDAEYKAWHDAQPECWAEDRRREAERKARERCLAQGNCVTFGIGSGTGAYGEGVGYGSYGAIGHGSGSVATAKLTSKTNVQVDGVDEPDIVKTDGRYVYMIANGALHIVEALRPRRVSTTRLAGFARDLVLEGDRVAVFASSRQGTERCTYGYDCEVAGDGSSTTITTLDVSNRAAPRRVRTVGLSGSLMAARRIGHTVHVVVADGDTATADFVTWPEDVPQCGTEQRVVNAKFFALRAKNERVIRASTSLPTITDQGVTKDLCAGLLESRFDSAHTFTSVVSFDLTDATAAAASATVRSRPGVVFASPDALYLATHRRRRAGALWYDDQPAVNEATEVHKFHLGPRPGDTRYLSSGTVPGHVLSPFAMDEWRGDLRVATTRGKVPDPKVESQVTILREGPRGLARVGALEHLARGEDLRAIRFDDDRGYLVTFKKTDPLFVVDLADARSPRVLGELKIPGFSTYLHRVSRDRLLSVGFDANDHGDYATFDGLLLQLFDVTSPTAPKLLHREKIGSRGSSSTAATDHLAFNYLPERGLLALPVTQCERGGDGVAGTEVAFSGLSVYRVSEAAGFERLGGVAHAHARDARACGTWWSHATSEVKRSVFLDDLVYSMATDRVKVQRLGALGVDVADVSLAP
jgi:hypothetical protein